MTDSFLQAATAEARQGLAEEGIPIGAVIVHRGRIIGRGHNRRVQQGSAILHGEMDAFENAGRQPASVYRDSVLYTDTGPEHPERPDRIAVLLPVIDAMAETITRIPARAASGEDLALIHDPAYVEDVAATQQKPVFAFDADTPTSPATYASACLAAGGFLAVLDAVMANKVDNGFAMVRPPGHHAGRDQAMGCCFFNNAAVGAEYLRRRHALERVLIVDWDLHHGNGTQHMFEDDPGVLYVSTHQNPYYPGTGAADGEGVVLFNNKSDWRLNETRSVCIQAMLGYRYVGPRLDEFVVLT